jgi:hypothetical protein
MTFSIVNSSITSILNFIQMRAAVELYHADRQTDRHERAYSRSFEVYCKKRCNNVVCSKQTMGINKTNSRYLRSFMFFQKKKRLIKLKFQRSDMLTFNSRNTVYVNIRTGGVTCCLFHVSKRKFSVDLNLVMIGRSYIIFILCLKAL